MKPALAIALATARLTSQHEDRETHPTWEVHQYIQIVFKGGRG